ncbi:annexin D5-like protein [Tanacetum coccineum]
MRWRTSSIILLGCTRWCNSFCKNLLMSDPLIFFLVQLLLAYLSTPRSEGLEVDRTMADHDANACLKLENSAYHNMYGSSLKKAVKGETSGNFEHALVTILQCAENPGKYFAKVMHRAMKGLGTNDKTLIRVIVTRTEIDMQYIKAEYHKKHHKSLNDAVHSETSGHYRTFLLSLLGPNHH